jgi:hypothetical protein
MTLQRTEDSHETVGVILFTLKWLNQGVLERQRRAVVIRCHSFYRRTSTILLIRPTDNSKRSAVMPIEGR